MKKTKKEIIIGWSFEREDLIEILNVLERIEKKLSKNKKRYK